MIATKTAPPNKTTATGPDAIGLRKAEHEVVNHPAVIARDKRKPAPYAANLAASFLTALVLSACNKAPSEPPAPTMKPVQNATVPTAEGSAVSSVPEASSVLAPAAATKADPDAGKSNNAMSRAQESSAMPIPGQNNDHSAPPAPAKRASGP